MQNEPSLFEEMTFVTRKARTMFDNHVKEKGLTLARARILRLLRNSDAGATQRSLALELEIEGPTLVRLLDNLEAQFCIERVPVASDRRAKQIILTSEGFRQADEVEDIVSRFRAEIHRGVDAAEVEVVLNVIARMSANLDALQ